MKIVKEFFNNWDFLADLKNALVGFDFFRDLVDILIVSVLIYYLLKLIRDTRAIQLLKGFGLIAIVYLFVTILQLKTMIFILDSVLRLGIIAIAILFQPELRRALEQVGRIKIPFLKFSENNTDNMLIRKNINILCNSAAILSGQKTGALIVIERDTKLGEIIDTGTTIDAVISEELIGNIFYPKSPLHDGAGVIRGGRIVAAGCFLPISENMSISKELGTRHRAALGMSENSDALVLIVSEETGDITIAEDGKLYRKLDAVELKSRLEKGLISDDGEDKSKRSFWKVKVNGK